MSSMPTTASSQTSATALLHQTLLGDAGDHAAVPIIVFDDGRNFVAVNEAYCRFTGYGREEILALRGGDSLAGDERTRLAFDEVVSERADCDAGRARLRRKDGEVLDVVWLTIRAEIAGLPYFIGMLWPEDSAPFRVGG
jgi:PAS domain S-box-containing protein